MIEIGGLQRSTLIDYPGHVACTVFLIGCNFRCPWCYSPEIVLPDLITKQPRIESDDFFEFLDIRKGLLDGVVICGGEPTINGDLPEFVQEIKRRGFKVKLDTNGSNPSAIDGLLKNRLLDYVAMDIKAPFAKYNKAVGVKVDSAKVRESIDKIKSSGVDYEFRTTVVPGIHQKEDIVKMAQSIAPAKRYFLQAFRSDKNIDASFTNRESFSDKVMEEIRDEVKSLFETCEVR